ncbi:MAG TPA: alpha/beta hydrolase [Acidimicrobiia bacterium]|nr:alpha/beta hydrolase [Acidimicrobiia bacterium]
MPLHPQAQSVCDLVNAMGDVPPSNERLEEVRAGFATLVVMGAGAPEPVFAIDDTDADGVPIRVYRPSADRDLPVIVYFHGGGWTIGSVEQFDLITRQIANATKAIVVSVDYRLAPEHPYPAPLDDCWRALTWVAKNAASFGGDGSRLAVMGDSAGGNLAAVCALLARDAGGPEIAMQVLVYPAVDGASLDTESYRDNAKGYLLTIDDMNWFYACYTSGGADPTDWRISPLRAPDLRGVAPAVVVTAEFDPLRDEGDAYALRLAEAGVPVARYPYDGMIHAFFGLSAAFDASRDALQRVSTDLQRAFGTLSD